MHSDPGFKLRILIGEKPRSKNLHPICPVFHLFCIQCCAELWMQIRLDLHSFSLLDLNPDPRGKSLRKETQKKGMENGRNCNFIF